MAHSLNITVSFAGAGRPSLVEAEQAKDTLAKATALLTLAGLIPAEVKPAVSPAAAVAGAFGAACSSPAQPTAKKAAKAADKARRQESAAAFKAAVVRLTGQPYETFQALWKIDMAAAKAIQRAAQVLSGQRAA